MPIDEKLFAIVTRPIDALPFSGRTSNILKRNGVHTVIDLLSLQESDLRGMRGVGSATMTEVRTTIRNYIFPLIKKHSREEIGRAIREISKAKSPIPQNHLLIRKIFLTDDDTFALEKLDTEVRRQLKDIGIHTDSDLLNNYLCRFALIEDVGIRTWKRVYGKFKQVYIDKIIQRDRRSSDQQNSPYGIEQLGLNKRAENRLLFAGITDIQHITHLTFADLLSIKEFGPLTLGELLTALRDKLDEINLTPSPNKSDFPKSKGHLPDSIINKLENFGVGDLDELERYTFEDLVVRIHLSYYEAQQISNYLATTDKKLLPNWPKNSLVQPSDYQFLKKADIPLNRISVSRLALPINLERQLKSLKIETIDSVALQSSAVLKTVFGRPAEEFIDILTKNLKTYFAWLPTQTNWDDEIEARGISPLYFIWLKNTTLEEVIDDLLNHITYERSRQVIRLRFGLDGGGQRTLQQVGRQLDLTRERIRQIEKKSLKTLKKEKSVGLIRALHISIENEMKTHGGLMSLTQIGEYVAELTEIGEVDLDGAISLLLLLRSNQFVQVQKNKRWGLKEASLNLVQPVSKQLIQILQSVSAPLLQSDLIERFIQSKLYSEEKMQHLVSTGFVVACLSTDERFEEIEDNQWGLTRWRKRRTADIVMALRKLGKPSHFTEIAEVANETLPPSQRASTRVYHAQLGNKPHLFAWVGPGTFGLVEWGLKRARFYVDIAEELLQKRGDPLTFEEIFHVINAEREASPESIKFMLGTNPRFRQYPDNRYGLTSWDEEENNGNDDEDDSFLDNLKQQLFDDFFDE